MKIFFDFDDVLFDSRRFKDDYFEIFKKRGISRSFFEECYYDPLDNENIKVYDPIKHIGRICQKTDTDCSVLEKDAADFVADTSRYVFADVKNLLGKFDKNDLYILSFSQTNFQKSKIGASGITDFFNRIVIVNQLKGDAMADVIKNEGFGADEAIYYVEDRTEQIGSVKKRCPQARTILCARPEGRYHDEKNDYCDYQAANMKEVEEIIRNK